MSPNQVIIIARQWRDNIGARRNEIWFQEIISSQAVGRKGREGIIANINGAFIIGGANGNHKGIIGWRIETLLAAIANRNHNCYLIKPKNFQCRIECTFMIGLGHSAVERKIDYFDVIGGTVFKNPLQASDYVGGIAIAPVIHHLHINQFCFRGNTKITTSRGDA